MNLDTIITIAIIVVSLIVGAIGKSKRLQEGQNKQPGKAPVTGSPRFPSQSSAGNQERETSRQPSFDDIFRTVMGAGQSESKTQHNSVRDIIDKPVSELDTPNGEEGIRTTDKTMGQPSRKKQGITAAVAGKHILMEKPLLYTRKY